MPADIQRGKLRGQIQSSIVLKGQIHGRQTLRGEIRSTGILRGEVNVPQINADDIYTGAVEVIPDIDGQTLHTQFKTMPADISVQPIPFAAVSNVFGGTTITIGG